MVELIKQTKDSMLERMEQAINERGADRIDVSEMGKLADIVKDLMTSADPQEREQLKRELRKMADM